MLNPELYSSMFARKSIRKYDETKPLSPEQLALVKAEISKATPLLPEEKFFLDLAPAKEGWRVYGYCENTPPSNANLGFVLQQLDLALYLQGMGRLWFGMGREPKDSKPPKDLSYAMCLKVGNAAEPLARADVNEFDRKEVITDDAALAQLLEPARLAPSAMNSQPWWFTYKPGAILVWRKQPGLKKWIIGRMNQIDMGICLCHAVLALEHAGKAFTVEVNSPEEGLADYDYLLTLKLDE